MSDIFSYYYYHNRYTQTRSIYKQESARRDLRRACAPSPAVIDSCSTTGTIMSKKNHFKFTSSFHYQTTPFDQIIHILMPILILNKRRILQESSLNHQLSKIPSLHRAMLTTSTLRERERLID